MCRNPINCVIPEHMLHSIALNGNRTQRAIALATLSSTTTFQANRLTYGERIRVGLEAPSGPGPLAAIVGAGVPHKTRTIYTASNTQLVPGKVVRQEGCPNTGDPAVDEAYNFMGSTFDFYWNVFQRDSLDDKGLPLNGTVHYSRNYDNAYWDGQRMIYGDGDGQQFTRFTVSVDVIGHEMTHGVTQYESGLIYYGQPGALNESISDSFGSMVRQYYYGQNVQQADWLIGPNLFIPGRVNGRAIRDMANPGTAYNDPVLGQDPQPANMKNYVHTAEDNGGVHTNSGICNKAFHNAAMYIGGFSWQGVGPIWYQACLSPQLRRTATFRDFASLTVSIAQQLALGSSGNYVDAVRQAWADVGINV
jgi:Zn-dependent metalloprotease